MLLGYLVPESGPALNPDSVTSSAVVVVIFFTSGLTLPSEALRRGLGQFRPHAYLQAFIFLLTPLYFLSTTWLLGSLLEPRVRVGMYALACLPTTVSSCVVLTQRSGGNVVGAMFNAALANAAGVLLTPLLLSLLLQETGQALPAGEMVRIFRDLLLRVLVPIAAGQALRPRLRLQLEPAARRIGTANNLLIVLIVFFAFAKAAGNPGFPQNLGHMPLPFAFLALSHLFLLGLALLGARLLGFGRDDSITTLFTAPQKTIAMGVPLLSTYFASTPEMLGLAILPLLFYHPWQLLVAGMLSGLPALRGER